MENLKNINILIAEDDMDDRLLIKKAFKESFSQANIVCVENGLELIKYLKREDQFYNDEVYPFPQLILLDLNMPKKDGREALQEIKSDSELKKIPVIIFTTSKLEDDIKITYTMGSSSYITKPGSFDELIAVGRALETYWSKTVLLPS